jgi:hypothetical protein
MTTTVRGSTWLIAFRIRDCHPSIVLVAAVERPRPRVRLIEQLIPEHVGVAGIPRRHHRRERGVRNLRAAASCVQNAASAD